MNSLHIIKAECIKSLGNIKSYGLNYIFSNINVLFLFYGLFYTFSVSANSANNSLSFLMGLMYWYYGSHAVDLLALIIEEEIEQGTLEQILMSKTGLKELLFYQIFVQILFDTLKGIFVFAICVWLFQIPLELIVTSNFIYIIIVFFVGLIGLYGVGYMIAGMALVFKRVTSVSAVCSYIILYFLGAVVDINLLPAVLQYVIKLFPVYWGNNLISTIANHGISAISNIQWSLFLMSVVGWIVFGLFIFEMCLSKIYVAGSTNDY